MSSMCLLVMVGAKQGGRARGGVVTGGGQERGAGTKKGRSCIVCFILLVVLDGNSLHLSYKASFKIKHNIYTHHVIGR